MALPKSLPKSNISEDSLSKFLRDIRKFPMLGEKEEYELANQWISKQDKNAAKQLINSHLRLVAKIATGYRGYGLPLAELVSEGTMGLMQAVKRYDPEKGVRLSTYAMWWIRASIQEYVLRSWSLVKITATKAQKKLFFNLRRLKGEMQSYDDSALSPEDLNYIAKTLDVSESDVKSMNQRMQSNDSSLNAHSSKNSDTPQEWQDWLEDESSTQEENLANTQEYNVRWNLIKESLSVLNEREKDIITVRHLEETPHTLNLISKKYNIAKERVRQIETRAMQKLQESVRDKAKAIGYHKS